MKLYVHNLSGHAHRARLFASLAGIEVEPVNVELTAGDHKKPEFLAINPFGQVPVLDDDGVIVPDSNAIMVYLAKKFGKAEWLPEDAVGAARVQRWLSVAAGQIAFGPAAARLITVFGSKSFNADDVIARAHSVLQLIEVELRGRAFIAADRPTIADVALYSYIARAPEGNVDLSAYLEINAWLRRIEALSGFVAFAKTPVGIEA
jgi:glutathione S-transferase